MIVFVCISWGVSAQGFRYTEGSDLTIVGKILTATSNPYHRVDTTVFNGFDKSENAKVRMSSGIAVAFSTNSTSIAVMTKYANLLKLPNTNGYSSYGYDLYIKKDGRWLFAGAGVCDSEYPDKGVVIVQDMDDSVKECLLYLPLYSEVASVRIGVEERSFVEPLENPFRHRIAAWGSSYTQGSCTSRAGMSYLAQLSRNTGLQFLSLGCGGCCKLQPYFTEVLCAAEADAFLLDTFSNGSPEQIKERLFPFIETLQKSHPGKPLIFQSTIRREIWNFNKKMERWETRRMEVVDSLMNIAVEKYPDVYFIHPDATSENNDATVDGIHPTNYGYTLWAKSIEKSLLKILRKYNIR